MADGMLFDCVGDNETIEGPELAAHLLSLGFITDAYEIASIPVGGCFRTGVSAYERIK